VFRFAIIFAHDSKATSLVFQFTMCCDKLIKKTVQVAKFGILVIKLPLSI